MKMTDTIHMKKYRRQLIMLEGYLHLDLYIDVVFQFVDIDFQSVILFWKNPVFHKAVVKKKFVDQ